MERHDNYRKKIKQETIPDPLARGPWKSFDSSPDRLVKEERDLQAALLKREDSETRIGAVKRKRRTVF